MKNKVTRKRETEVLRQSLRELSKDALVAAILNLQEQHEQLQNELQSLLNQSSHRGKRDKRTPDQLSLLD